MAAGAANAGKAAPKEAAAVVSTIRIERARWHRDQETLEVRGQVSSPSVELTAEFLDRSELLSNEQGEFRAELSDVTSNPGSVLVRASDGARADARVEED